MTQNAVLELIGRNNPLFLRDIAQHCQVLNNLVSQSRFLVLGAAGTIGSAVTREIAKRNPTKLHIVDISENNLVELVRDLRCSFDKLPDAFKALPLDIGSTEYDAFIADDGQYDYVLNLSALKHVRSEKDPFTLMRMLNVNIFNTEKTIQQSINCGVKKYFCVSTDKAANPVNLMGASKRIMELFLVHYSKQISISTARFANVAFSDGSLLFGFDKRIEKQQPIVAPNDVKRYFVTQQESGELCLLSCLLGENREVFFPKPSAEISLTSFSDIAKRYLQAKGLMADICSSEADAKAKMAHNQPPNWPCLFTGSDTTGEKPFEEFFTQEEQVNLNKFSEIGVVNLIATMDESALSGFKQEINLMIKSGCWNKQKVVASMKTLLPQFEYTDLGKYLDSKM
ncbi:UDP-N-acetylglucosamine 4,6-dehydratase [Bermanella sp. WJH001]|uniref:UDP-N-acetylglucosamine 4,6-dehydratase n=1 Tax=Bermanella sp. WJH001 TaxID=3048005 RepID=UPI0024BE6A86|nr:UDP-N-acetylglucosamine 4,6-dehydratase [Bermanella sp. WJH001]MDJ1537766.1 UDP-N-acetylglucosamine 4,6-dehydratase [Bermanella sp. WJH001]